MTKRQKGIKFMQKRIVKNDLEINAKTGRIEQACARYGVGRSTMRNIAKKAGAEVKIGKCYLINFSKVDAYMDNMCE